MTSKRRHGVILASSLCRVPVGQTCISCICNFWFQGIKTHARDWRPTYQDCGSSSYQVSHLRRLVEGVSSHLAGNCGTCVALLSMREELYSSFSVSCHSRGGMEELESRIDRNPILARPPLQPPAILSGTPGLGWTPFICGRAGCWQINSILANNGRRILNHYPFQWNIPIWA